MDTLIANFSTLTVAPEAHVVEMVPFQQHENTSQNNHRIFTNSEPVFMNATTVAAFHPILHHIQPYGMSNEDYSKLCISIYHKNITIEEILLRTNIDFTRTLFNNEFFTDEEIHTFIDKYTANAADSSVNATAISSGVTLPGSRDPRMILHLFYVAGINKCQKFLLPYYDSIIYTLYKIIDNFIDPNTTDMIKILDWFMHRGIKPNDDIFHFMIKNNEITIVQWILNRNETIGTVNSYKNDDDPFMWIDDINDHSMITTLLQHGYFPSQQFLDHVDNFMYDYIVNFNHHGGD